MLCKSMHWNSVYSLYIVSQMYIRFFSGVLSFQAKFNVFRTYTSWHVVRFNVSGFKAVFMARKEANRYYNSLSTQKGAAHNSWSSSSNIQVTKMWQSVEMKDATVIYNRWVNGYHDMLVTLNVGHPYNIIREGRFKCVCLNTRSIVNNKNEINILGYITCVTESWANNNIWDAECGLPSIVMFSKRHKKKGMELFYKLNYLWRLTI